LSECQHRYRTGLLRVVEDPRVQVQVVVGLGLVDASRAAAGDRLELVELQAELRCQRLRRDVELLRGQRRQTALVVGDVLRLDETVRHQSPPDFPPACVGSTRLAGPFSGSPPSWNSIS